MVSGEWDEMRCDEMRLGEVKSPIASPNPSPDEQHRALPAGTCRGWPVWGSTRPPSPPRSRSSAVQREHGGRLAREG